jgi:RimJ/RimL family protein N-acetyltransferase
MLNSCTTLNVLETQRLLLAPLDVSRLEEFVVLTADPEVMRYWAPGGPFSRDAAERNLAASLARMEEHGFGRRWIVNKESGAGLGFTETKYFGESCDDVSPDEVEIGWMLTRSAWGHGYATEAGAAVRDEAFVSLDLESIVAVHHPANSASGRIMEKLGMEFERDVVTTTGWPYRLYRLTRDHWGVGALSRSTARGTVPNTHSYGVRAVNCARSNSNLDIGN